MPKRPSPFDEHLLPQLKVHVSEKEICWEENMKFVYEKTKELLFKGARTKVNGDVQFINPVPKPTNSDCLRQTYLNNNCQIETHSEKLVRLSNPTFEKCKSCCATNMVNCQLCESNLCFSCCVECESCELIYCSNCTISEYVGNKERITCHWCSIQFYK